MSDVLSESAVKAMGEWPALDTTLVATHWDGCEKAHPCCLAAKLRDSHERLRGLARELAAIADRARPYVQDALTGQESEAEAWLLRDIDAALAKAGLLGAAS